MTVRRAYVLLACLLSVNLIIWMAARPVQAIWLNVPPPPDKTGAIIGAYGDKEIAYRSIGYIIQNLGDHGGAVRNIDEYNYPNLKEWLFLTDELNQKSDYVPRLAGLYFGITRNPVHSSHLVDYLSEIGQRPYDSKWRWLLLAITYSKNKVNDTDRAIHLARILEQTDYPRTKPSYTKRLLPMLYFSKGDKDKAYLEFLNVFHKRYHTLSYNDQEFVIEFFCREFTQYNSQHPVCMEL